MMMMMKLLLMMTLIMKEQKGEMTAACPADVVDGANMVSPSMISHPFI